MLENRYSNYTELDLIKEAQLVQDACNLSGVVHSFSAAIRRLREIFNDRAKHTDFRFSTTDINQHQVCRLFADKIRSLAGEVQFSDFDSINS